MYMLFMYIYMLAIAGLKTVPNRLTSFYRNPLVKQAKKFHFFQDGNFYSLFLKKKENFKLLLGYIFIT